MKKIIIFLLICELFILAIETGAYASGGAQPSPTDGTNVSSTNLLSSNQMGQGYATAEGGLASAEGGDADADASSIAYSEGSSSGAIANISTSSVSNYKTRTPPVSMYPPYLPYWTHGGWGTVTAYFPNGPNSDDTVYERTFNHEDPDDMKELRGVLVSLPYQGPLEFIGGIFNGVSAAFGGPDKFHRGRGFDIASSIIRDLRPKGKPLIVFVDSNVDKNLLKEAGYAYVGKVSVEGKTSRNWDHVYDAAVAETLLWDVDILLVSGGMKGVSVGSNTSFPIAGGAFSQTNFSISLFGAKATGITEGKGKAMLSAEGYRFWPEVADRRRIPKALYDRIRARPGTQQAANNNTVAKAGQKKAPSATMNAPSAAASMARKEPLQGVEVSRELFEMTGYRDGQVQYLTVR